MKTTGDSANVLAYGFGVLMVGCMLIMLLGGCASGPNNVLVTVPPYASQPVAREGSMATRSTVRIDRIRDARRDAVGGLIGERTTIGNVSMGNIEMSPLPTTMMATVLRAELTAMGFGVADSGEQFQIGAQLTRFQVATPATALYWDINGAIEFDMTATGQGGKVHQTRYVATCTDRTYAWPSEELIGGVISACLKDIGSKIRGDTGLSGFLSAR